MDAGLVFGRARQRRRGAGVTRMVKTGNAVPVATSSVAVADSDSFRGEILSAIEDGWRLLLLVGLSQDADGTRLLAALADDRQGEIGLIATDVAGSYPALTPDCPAAHYFEREIHEQWAVRPEGHPWLKPVRFRPGGPAIEEYDFFQVAGAEIHEVAVGPVHAGIIEPGHFRFNCHGERVIHLEIMLGYQHRGVDEAMRGGHDKRSG